MEDAHTTILDLDTTDESAEAQCGSGKKGKHSFFAVYDGHGGKGRVKQQNSRKHNSLTRAFACTDLSIYSLYVWLCAGSTVARYSGDTVHRRLRDLSEYQTRQYHPSLKRAFIKTDEDLRSSAYHR